MFNFPTVARRIASSHVNNIVLLLMFGVFIGLTTVFFGFGGGFVVVPVLYGLNAGHPDAMHIAVATSTAVMVVNASIATFTSRSTGLIRRDYLMPLAVFIAGGAAIGALVATRAPDSLVHALFVAYLLIAIIDAVARRGFLERSGDPRPLGKAASAVGGLGIGAVAAFLGVGGSVMTVPLLRRRQVSMAAATAMANPLSIPVALVGTVMYSIPVSPSTRWESWDMSTSLPVDASWRFRYRRSRSVANSFAMCLTASTRSRTWRSWWSRWSRCSPSESRPAV